MSQTAKERSWMDGPLVSTFITDSDADAKLMAQTIRRCQGCHLRLTVLQRTCEGHDLNVLIRTLPQGRVNFITMLSCQGHDLNSLSRTYTGHCTDLLERT